MNVFDLAAKLSVDTSAYEAGMNAAMASANKLCSVMASIGAAVTKVAGSFIDAATSTASYGDNIDKMSQKIGISAQAYQEWSFVMEHCGTSIDVMQAGMKTLSSAVTRGSESATSAFNALGISIDQAASMSQEDLFTAVIYGLQQMESGAERTSIASTLLGRSATELGALLNTSAADTQNMINQVHSLNGVMSDEAVRASAGFADSLQNMRTAMQGFKNNLMAEFLPSLSTVMDGLAKIFAGDSSGLALIRQGVNNFAVSLRQVIPTFVAVAGEIIQSIASALMQNMPVILQSAMYLIQTFINGISQNMPMILNMIGQMLNMVAQALGENAGIIGEMFVNIIVNIFKHLPSILWNVCKGIGKGIINWITGKGTDDYAYMEYEMQSYGSAAGRSLSYGVEYGFTSYMPTAYSNSMYAFSTAFSQFSSYAEQVGGGGGTAFGTGLGRQVQTGIQAASSEASASLGLTFAGIESTAQVAGTQTANAYSTGLATIDTASYSSMSSVATSFATSANSISTSMANVDSTTLTHLNSMVSNFVNAGNSFASAMSSAFASILNTASSGISSVSSTIASGFTGIASIIRQTGSDMVAATNGSMNGMQSAIASQLNSIKAHTSNWGSQIVSQFRSIGSNIVGGLIDGIRSGTSALNHAVQSMVNSTVAQAKSGLDIHSPSRVFRDQVGYNITAGIAEGIDSSIQNPLRSIDELNNNMTGTVDVGNVSAGGDMSGKLDAILKLMTSYLPNIGGDILLDGDVLVGQLSGRIDRSLGSMTASRSRGGAAY